MRNDSLDLHANELQRKLACANHNCQARVYLNIHKTLAVKATAVIHAQLFEVRRRAPLRRDAARELVRWRPSVVPVIAAQIELLKRRRQHLRQRPCAREANS